MKKFFLIAAAVILAGLAGGGWYMWMRVQERAKSAAEAAELARKQVRFRVVGASMSPTLQDGDWLLGRTDQQTFRRGQLVIMRYPEDTSKILSRRVVAISGDRVVVKYYPNVKVTTIYERSQSKSINFPENVAPEGASYKEQEMSVGDNLVYVAGDNTVPGGSFDSDEWGLLPLKNIVAVVQKRTEPNPRTF